MENHQNQNDSDNKKHLPSILKLSGVGQLLFCFPHTLALSEIVFLAHCGF